MLGSHYDTVRDAGKWDGPLGVITAISCVADLNRRGVRLPFAIEVTGFADEEGVRFASTLLGSRAVAECIVAVEALCRTDGAGLVGTVGAITALPGATNVIPGRVSFTLDIRAPADAHRKLAVAEMVRRIEAIAKRRDLSLQIDVTHENRTSPIIAPSSRRRIRSV